jgi:ribulose-5-phosphate 4-epimerase/fuculose-1-phosphate aldolase
MNCIMHVHTKAIMGVSAQAEGVGPYSQAYLMIGGGDVIGYTDYEFECTDDFLSELLRAGTGKKMIVEAWHGAFVFGTSAGEAFFRSFYLDQACAVQLEVQKSGAGGATIRTIPKAEQARHLAAAAARCEQRLVRDGGRPLPSAKRSDVDLLGDAQRVIEFDAEVSTVLSTLV